jgi:phosphohistidine phosphatase SixA
VIVLVRHGVALRRHEWDGPDRYRPLSERGRKQAGALAESWRALAPSRVLSSPATRCVETVEPLAEALGLAVEEVDDLYEGHGNDASTLVRSCGDVVVSSHGDVLPELLDDIVRALGIVDVPHDPPFAKAGAWIVDGSSARYVAPPA